MSDATRLLLLRIALIIIGQRSYLAYIHWVLYGPRAGRGDRNIRTI
jgi:hypothetical protein